MKILPGTPSAAAPPQLRGSSAARLVQSGGALGLVLPAQNEDKESEELNLNTVLLLNPKNEEAIYMLMKLKVNKSDFSETDELLARFRLVCVSICSKGDEIQDTLNNLSSKHDTSL